MFEFLYVYEFSLTLLAFNYGAGSNPIPTNAQYVGAVPQPWDQTSSGTVFGTQVAWDLTKLSLPFGSKIRFQFMVHDGDQRGNTGGDVGQVCHDI